MKKRKVLKCYLKEDELTNSHVVCSTRGGGTSVSKRWKTREYLRRWKNSQTQKNSSQEQRMAKKEIVNPEILIYPPPKTNVRSIWEAQILDGPDLASNCLKYSNSLVHVDIIAIIHMVTYQESAAIHLLITRNIFNALVLNVIDVP